MSGHHNDDHSFTENKPVAFTVPFFLAAAFIIAVVLFLSLCDPKPHQAHSSEHAHGQEHTNAVDQGQQKLNTEEKENVVQKTDSVVPQASAPETSKEHH